MQFLFNIGFLEIRWVDILDILLVGLLLFQLYQLLKGSVALKIFIGFLSFYLMYLIVSALEMELLSTILGQFMGVGVIAAIILFQQEIRKFLLLVGKTASIDNDNVFKNLFWKKNNQNKRMDLSPIIEAVKFLGGTNTGALIVIAKSSELKLYADTGDYIDAEISKRILLSIFNKNSPLHDGAVIISKNRIKAARCILPVTENNELPAFLGLRHRAAIGISEINDSVVLVVSEETGEISIARNGKLYHNLSPLELRNKLNQYLFEDKEIEEEEEDQDIEKKDENIPI